ncbi:hypothetical protein K435DRAFT_810751 [Dendrothele bispora CBS 962.96]|uniref:Uncharacterized protein n=1 Tax=Dendrothele bispora (strain CBS 962.96) TaxID=1314807 RepID=A0A4S8KU53_DENBC|nr:hypothetical protein K435DRAFT_810751 [Dendrothele bispora CBS 962.96]
MCVSWIEACLVVEEAEKIGDGDGLGERARRSDDDGDGDGDSGKGSSWKKKGRRHRGDLIRVVRLSVEAWTGGTKGVHLEDGLRGAIIWGRAARTLIVSGSLAPAITLSPHVLLTGNDTITTSLTF